MNLLNQPNPGNEATLIADAVKGNLDAFKPPLCRARNFLVKVTPKRSDAKEHPPRRRVRCNQSCEILIAG